MERFKIAWIIFFMSLVYFTNHSSPSWWWYFGNPVLKKSELFFLLLCGFVLKKFWTDFVTMCFHTWRMFGWGQSHDIGDTSFPSWMYSLNLEKEQRRPLIMNQRHFKKGEWRFLFKLFFKKCKEKKYPCVLIFLSK